MSHAAIAAALALEDVSAAERLVAFSLASYANRDHCAWPSAAAAAARAGMSRGRFLAARDGLVRAGLLVVEDSRGGRGRSSTVRLAFADTGERFDAQINASLFERALTFSRARGGARLLIAVMAALADEHGQLSGFSASELAAGAGLSNTSYRRARAALRNSGEVRLDNGLGGRGNTNSWAVTLPELAPSVVPARTAPPAGARPLLAKVRSAAGAEDRDATEVAKGAGKGAVVGTVSASKGAAGETVSGRKGAGAGTVCGQRAPKRAPKRAPPNARAGGEPRNLRTCPPSPPEGGAPRSQVTIVEKYVTDRGRTRQRQVTIDQATVAAHFAQPASTDRCDWAAIRAELQRTVGEGTFAIWLEPLTLRAIDPAGALLLDGPSATWGWVTKRFQRLLERASAATGRQLRLVDDRERQLLDSLSPGAACSGATELPADHARRAQGVLSVDCDPQANLSEAFDRTENLPGASENRTEHDA
jgi:hypothetical protein